MADAKPRKMPFVPLAQRDSAYYSLLASRRKKIHHAFEDKEFAKKMAKKSHDKNKKSLSSET